MSDKIGYEDLFDPNIQAKYKALTDAFVEGLKKYRDELKAGLSDQKEFFTGFKVGGSEDIKKLNEELEKTNKKLADLTSANKAVEQSEKELAKLREQEIKLMRSREKSIDDFTKKETNAATKKLKAQEQERLSEIQLQKAREKAFDQFEKQNRAYTKLSKEVRDLKNAYKDAAVAEGEMSKNAQTLLAKLTPLEQKLKRIDGNVGDFQRNVGNYQSALNGTIGNLLGAAGISLGVGAVVSLGNSVIKTRAEFQKFEAVLTNTLGSKSEAQKSLSEIQEFASKTPFGVSELTASFVKLANQGFKPTIKEMTSLGDLASSQGKSFDQLSEAILDATTGEFERLKEFGVRAKKEGDKVTFTFKGVKQQVDFTDDSIRKYVLSLGDASGVSGSMAAVSETLEGKISNLKDQYDSFLNTVGEKTEPVVNSAISSLSVLLNGIQGFVSDFSDLLSGNLLASNNVSELQRIGDITKQNALQIEDAGFRIGNVYDAADQKIAKNLNTIITTTNFYSDAIKNAKNKQDEYKKTLNGSQQQLDEINKRYANGTIGQEEYRASLNLLDKRTKVLKESYSGLGKEIKTVTGLTKDQQKEAERLSKQIDSDEARLKKQIEDQQDQSILTNQVREEALAKREFERKKKDIEESKASQETKNEALLQLELEYYNKRADIENKYIDEKEKKDKDARDKAKKENEDNFNEAIKLQEEELKKSDDIESERLKKAKEAREKQRKEAFDAANQLLEIAEKRINQEQDLINDAIDDEISKRQSAVDEQKRRAEQGLSSDIATAEKNLKDAEARKKEIENQAIKRQQALTFFKLLSANAESDPNNALTKTFTEMLLSEALVKSLPGFFKGTENVERDLKGNKVHNGRDGHVIAVDGGERVMTGDQNKLMGGMANDDVANLVYRHNNNLLPNYMISEPLSPMGVAENMYNSIQLQQLLKQNEELIRAVKSIPGTNIMFSDGKMKRTDNVNGFKTTTIKPFNRAF